MGSRIGRSNSRTALVGRTMQRLIALSRVITASARPSPSVSSPVIG
jgi:hypothetical protein